MRLLIQIAKGVTKDYTRYVLDGSTNIQDSVNVPTLFTFQLSNIDEAFVPPPRSSYVTLISDIYAPNGGYGTGKILFTGFVTTVPERVFLGLANYAGNTQFQVYQYNVQATSDEWLLNCNTVPYIPAFVNQTDSQILESIAEALAPGLFDFSQMGPGTLVPYFAYDPSQTWSDVAKNFADANRYYYKVINKKIIYQPFGDAPLGIAYDDQNMLERQLAPSSLTTSVVSVPPVNDCLVLGDTEPQTNWENYYVGDGFTSNFQLRHQVFQGTSSTLLQDDWTENSFTQGTWIVNDPLGVELLADSNGNAIGALNIVQKGFSGQYLPLVDATYIQAQNGLELGGGINLQHGSITFNDVCNGLIGSVFGVDSFTPGNVLCGYGITGQQNLGSYTVTAVQILNGNTQLVNLTIQGTAPPNIQPGNVLNASAFTNATFLNGHAFTVVSVSQGTGSWVLQVQGSFIYASPYGPTSDSGMIQFPANAVFVTASGAAGVVIQPIFSGQYVGTPVVTQVNHQYTLQTWIGAGAPTRFTRPYTNLTRSQTYGAQNLASSGTITWVITDVNLGNYVIEQQNPLFGLFPSAPPPVVTKFSLSQVSLPPFGIYCLVNCIDLNCSINYTLLSLPPQGYLTVRSLTGASGGNLPWLPSQLSAPIVYQLGVGQINQTAQISEAGQTFELAFYTDDIPSVGARIVFQSWAAGQSVARVTDPVAIANEAIISGDNGVRAAIMTNLSPLPRTSDECEAAAGAAILDREYPQFQGTYTVKTIPYRFENLYAPSLYDYPRTGRFLYINSPNRGVSGQNFFANSVTFQILEFRQEVMTITVDYGPDTYLEKLLPAFLERDQNILTPTQSVQPPNPITIDQVLEAYLPTLDNAKIVNIINYGSASITTGAAGVTGGILGQSYVTVNLFAPPITACEVRNVDSGWGIADQGRIGLFTASEFTLPRTARDQTWYLRALNGPLYSRFSKALRVVYPLVPSAPALVSADETTIVFDYAGDVRDIYGIELRANQPVTGINPFIQFPDYPEDEFAELARTSLLVPTDPAAGGSPVFNNGNVNAIYNPPSNSQNFPFPEELQLGDVVYVVCPNDESFGGFQIITNALNATGNTGSVPLNPGLSINGVVAFFMQNNPAFKGTFAYEYPIGAGYNQGFSTIEATVPLTSLEFNDKISDPDPYIQPITVNNYDIHGNFLGTSVPWAGATTDWCMAITGNLVVPQAGEYLLQCLHDDGCYIGFPTNVVSQTKPINNVFLSTAAINLPIKAGVDHSGAWKEQWGFTFPAPGTYPFEIDFAQWKDNQCMVLTQQGATIPLTVYSTPISGAPWGVGWFDYAEPFPDVVGNAVFGINTEVATVQIAFRGGYSTLTSGAIVGGGNGICTLYTQNAHPFQPGQQVMVGCGWQTFPPVSGGGYPALPNTGAVFCGTQTIIAIPTSTSFQFVSKALLNPVSPWEIYLSQNGVTPQYLNGLVAAMPSTLNLAATSGILIQRPVFAPSDLVIDLTQPDIAEALGLLESLSQDGLVDGLSAYFFNLTWDYSAPTLIASFQVPAITGVYINSNTQQVSWQIVQGQPLGYRVTITDPQSYQVYNQFTLDNPDNPRSLSQFQMSPLDFNNARLITITPFGANGDGVPVQIYHSGNGTGSGPPLYAECLDVRIFGAAGDGVTDDTLAIQNALNAAAQAAALPKAPGQQQGNATVCIPSSLQCLVTPQFLDDAMGAGKLGQQYQQMAVCLSIDTGVIFHIDGSLIVGDANPEFDAYPWLVIENSLAYTNQQNLSIINVPAGDGPWFYNDPRYPYHINAPPPNNPVSIAVSPGQEITLAYLNGLIGDTNAPGGPYGPAGAGYGTTGGGVYPWPSDRCINGGYPAGSQYSLCGGFANASGNLVTQPYEFSSLTGFGLPCTLTVPMGAVQLFLGVNNYEQWRTLYGSWNITVTIGASGVVIPPDTDINIVGLGEIICNASVLRQQVNGIRLQNANECYVDIEISDYTTFGVFSDGGVEILWETVQAGQSPMVQGLPYGLPGFRAVTALPTSLYSVAPQGVNATGAILSQVGVSTTVNIAPFSITWPDLQVNYAGGSIQTPAILPAQGLWIVFVDDTYRDGSTAVQYGVTNNQNDLATSAGRYFLGTITLLPQGSGTATPGGNLPTLSLIALVNNAFVGQRNVAFGCTWQGQLTPNTVIMHLPMALGIGSVTFPVAMSGSNGHLLTAPASGIIIPINKNGTLFATMTFAPGSNWPTFNGPAVILNPSPAAGQPGDYLTVVLPSTLDPLASDLGFELVGTIGTFSPITSSGNWIYNETPALTASGNVVTLSQLPVSGTIRLWRNGARQKFGLDIIANNQIITFLNNLVVTGDLLVADYEIGAQGVWVSNEVPQSVGGSTTVFTLSNVIAAGTDAVYWQGLRMKRNTDYTINGLVCTFNVPVTSSGLVADYQSAVQAGYVVGEIPGGTANGSNVYFTTASVSFAGTTQLYENGLREYLSIDYTVAGNTITEAVAPGSGYFLIVDYQY